MSKLGILVNTDRHLQHVRGFTRATLRAGHDVIIFVMDTGTRLLSDPAFQELADLPRVSITLCDHSAKVHGVAVDRLPPAIRCRTQLHNAMMNHQADRVIVLWDNRVEERKMRVLHLLSNGPDPTCTELSRLQSAECEVEVIDLSAEPVDYEKVVEKIFSSDKVISW